MLKEHETFCNALDEAEIEFKELLKIDDHICELSSNIGSSNPYTWFTRLSLEETWKDVMQMVQERKVELQKELQRQEKNDTARQNFAKEANLFYDWLTVTRYN